MQRRAPPGAGDGWSAFSRRNSTHSSTTTAPPNPDDFSPLPTSSYPQFPEPHTTSFASVVSRTLPNPHPHPSHARTPADPLLSRLLHLHPWADEGLIADVLRAFDYDEDSVSSYLSSISDESRLVTSASECPSSSQTDNDESASEAGEKLGFFPSSISFAPVEPEWVEDDIYYSSRKEALRLSRVSRKHSRIAHKAFLSGDHSRATMLSKEARKERLAAEQMHQEAAERIFKARNGDSPKDLWRLDMHGLHASEAVSVLRSRLLHVEALLCHSRHASGYVSDGNICGITSTKEVTCSDTDTLSSQKTTRRMKAMAEKTYVPFGRGLEVITGVGNHSREGGSLPTVIRNFLIQNRYKFEDSRPGTLLVYPKFQFQKDK